MATAAISGMTCSGNRLARSRQLRAARAVVAYWSRCFRRVAKNAVISEACGCPTQELIAQTFNHFEHLETLNVFRQVPEYTPEMH